MKTTKISEQNLSKRLQQSIVIYSALGILFISATVASVSILPLYSQLKQDEEKNLQFALTTKALAIEEYLSRAKDISLQIAGRTKAREKLEEYNLGKTTIKEVADFSQGILTEALNQSPDIAGIIRLDQREQPVIQLGEPIPKTIWAVPADATKKVVINAPIYLNGQSYLVLGTPIINQQSKRVGTDILLFKMTSLKRIVQDYTGLGETGETALGVVRDNQVQLFFPLRQNQNQEALSIPLRSPFGAALEKASRQDSGILYMDQSAGIPAVMAYGPVPNSDWGFVVKINQAELYAPLNRQVGLISTVILGLILLGTGGMVLLLRPLASRAILYSDELERQSQEKSTLLEEKTAALQLEIAQRQQIEEALQQMDELKASSRLSAEQATDAAAEATHALTLAHKGTQAVEQTLKGMETQKETVEAISKQILHLSQQTYQIASISNLVSDLANQTNMLALNAAVEAVRAGAQGKGFAVVAKEIRQLADQSKTSASKIHALISDIQLAIQSTVIVTDAGQRTVEEGEKIAQKTASAIAGMKDAIDKVVMNNQQISLNAEQQAIAIYQVVNAINALRSSKKDTNL